MSNNRQKYRVWDGKKKAYAHEGYVVTQLGLVGTYDPFVGLIRNIYCTVEHCTGLADKNGNPVFDGDVIQENGINRYIHWHDGGWCYSVRYDSKCHWRLQKEDVENAEIIGNIHDDQFRDLAKIVEGDNND
jgi:hypothetical protein